MQRRTAGTRRSRRGDGAGAQSGSTLIEEREGDLRCGARIVEPSDTQVEARRSALRLSCVQPNDRGWDGERGWLGRVTELDREHDVAGRGSGLKCGAVLRAEVPHSIAWLDIEGRGPAASCQKQDSSPTKRKEKM